MKYLCDFHTHTSYCDGNNTVREMADRAYELGFSALGFSGHGVTSFDMSYCMTEENTKKYLAEIAEMKKEYEGKLELLAGVEVDMHSPIRDTSAFDYVIASSHYIRLGDEYYALDINPNDFRSLVAEKFGGDYDALAEQYYSELGFLLDRVPAANIIGHLDLVTKYSELLGIQPGERYYAAALRAVDRLIPYGIPFEINVGAMTRGYRTSPYPAAPILRHICERGGEIIVTGDCHSAENLGKFLDTGVALAKECGFTHRVILTKVGYRKIEL